MMGRTHKVAGCCAMMGTFIFLWEKGLLVSDLHPLVQLAIMYPAASWGSTMPDLDQSSLQTIPEKTPMSVGLYYLLHIGKIKHRSWQTHSILTIGLLLLTLFGLVVSAYSFSWLGTSIATYQIVTLIIAGFGVGVLSHLLTDFLTYEGIQLVPGVWLHPLHFDAFKTGTIYEKIVRGLFYVASFAEVGYIIYKLVVLR